MEGKQELNVGVVICRSLVGANGMLEVKLWCQVFNIYGFNRFNKVLCCFITDSFSCGLRATQVSKSGGGCINVLNE